MARTEAEKRLQQLRDEREARAEALREEEARRVERFVSGPDDVTITLEGEED